MKFKMTDCQQFAKFYSNPAKFRQRKIEGLADLISGKKKQHH